MANDLNHLIGYQLNHAALRNLKFLALLLLHKAVVEKLAQRNNLRVVEVFLVPVLVLAPVTHFHVVCASILIPRRRPLGKDDFRIEKPVALEELADLEPEREEVPATSVQKNVVLDAMNPEVHFVVRAIGVYSVERGEGGGDPDLGIEVVVGRGGGGTIGEDFVGRVFGRGRGGVLVVQKGDFVRVQGGRLVKPAVEEICAERSEAHFQRSTRAASEPN